MRNPNHRKRRNERCEATGKFKYENREAAAHGLAFLTYNVRPEGRQPLSAYRCRECQEYHVGHTPREIVKRFGLGDSAE